MADTELETTPKKSRKKVIKVCVLAFIIVVLLVLLVIFGPYIWLVVKLNLEDRTYKKFDDNRIAEVEQMFDMTITDDFKLEKLHHEPSLFGEGSDTLYISGISSYEDFMEHNVHGTLDSKTVDGVLTSYRDGEKSTQIENKDVVKYVYFTAEYYEIWANFHAQDDGTYSAELNKWSR